MNPEDAVCGQQLVYISTSQRKSVQAECTKEPDHEGPHDDGWGHTWLPTAELGDSA